ncbi:hypothetical protein JRG19_10015 [Pseudoclavibacter alba]|uniref:hypothetical protein n=1 Tax=Pseudoclavibacter albus TaxID=272241 RepID=UPI0019D06A5E|nr:hypothetical protein [Pseudoclavibacter alba]MBN6778864.1 hypothetical protein [Pseudoclavibacter alba]
MAIQNLTQIARTGSSERLEELLTELHQRANGELIAPPIMVIVDGLESTRAVLAERLGSARAHDVITGLYRFQHRGRKLGVAVLVQQPILNFDTLTA